MPATRWARVLERLADHRGRQASLGEALCATCVDVIGLPGAGVMLLDEDAYRGSIGVSDPTMGTLEELEFTLGEGPCIDAYASGRAVSEPDLADPGTVRWPAFRGPALEAGARSVFGFPLQVGAARIGSLNLYHDRPAPLDHDQHHDAIVVAAVAGHAVLAEQAHAPPEDLAEELFDIGSHLARVHQATGMISVQLGTDVRTALTRLRARAYAIDESISAVAADVIERRLRFDDQD